jgi:hypothetical protein
LNGRTEMYRPERVVQSQIDEDLGAKSIASTHSGEPIDRPRSPDAGSC